MTSHSKKPAFITYKHTYVVLIAIGAVLTLGAYLGWHSLHSAKPTTSTTTPGSTSATGKQYSTPSTGSSVTSSTTSTPSSSSSSQSLPAPSGQLLNIQTVSLGAGPGLESVCQTIASASCDIRLTNGGTVKYVGTQNTGSNGIVIFDWNAKTVGLTTGQWGVQAVVTQNGVTGTSHTEYLTVQE